MKLSIITINYNDGEGLRKTLESVAGQTCRNFEYIVVDGGSSDNSLEVIKEFSDIIDKWVSESDRGIYNAMNKGVGMASGEYCLFLNSGDSLHSDRVIQNVLPCIKDQDIYFGELHNIWGSRGCKDFKFCHWSLNRDITLQTIFEGAIPHAGSFIRKSLMIKYPYREDMKICSDRDFFVKALIIDNCSYSPLSEVVCDFDMSGISSSSDQLLAKENLQILDELFPPRVVSDYVKTNLSLQDVTGEVVLYRRNLTKFICKVDMVILKLYKFLRNALR